MAEAFFLKETEGRGEYSVGSAGLAATKGGACSCETARVCKQVGASLDGFASQPVTATLLSEATHVFVMTGGHLAALEKRFPEFSEKYYLVCEFVDIPGLGIGTDVPDPIGMGPAAYQEVADVLKLAVPSIIAFIDQTG